MKQLSRLSVVVPARLFFMSVLMALCAALMPSCSTTAKTVKSAAESAGRLKSSEKSVEKRLDEMAARLQRIEQTLGLNEAQEQLLSDGNGQQSEQSQLDSQPLSQSQDEITEEILPPEDSPDVLHPPDSSLKSESSFSQSLTDSGASSPEAQYNRAMALLSANKFDAAAKEFRSVTEIYPDHPLAVNALYWMGECRYSVRDYRGSITIFKQLVEKYPKGRKVPDALLKTAYAYLSINDIDNGREYLKKVVRQFPFSPAGEKAEKRLQTLR